eukprot:TRINITY_DN94207_c0_g1_i1.p1 TRINITY_DN94207_c0_g1~~TRINITY_DN94207_c0_g1_i1.p1  ORF type:complete len:416 (-),score=90.06 TRINITY_DN94207_c0_g1_i1:29-1276(-)
MILRKWCAVGTPVLWISVVGHLVTNLQAVRLADADDLSNNPLTKLKLTEEDKKHMNRIASQVPQSLLDAISKAPRSEVDPEITCDAPDKVKSADDPVYDAKSAKGSCGDVSGMNGGKEVSHASTVRFRTVAKLFNLTSKHMVLDYGAGCGHQIDEVARIHGAGAVAFDQVKGAAQWAKDNLRYLKDYCVGTGTNMPFKGELFDFVLSNGVLGNLKIEDQCDLMRGKILDILKPGGCAWFGYLGNKGNGKPGGGSDSFMTVPMSTFLRDACIPQDSVQGPWVLNDLYLFGKSIYGPQPQARDDSYSVFFCKPAGGQQPPAPEESPSDVKAKKSEQPVKPAETANEVKRADNSEKKPPEDALAPEPEPTPENDYHRSFFDRKKISDAAEDAVEAQEKAVEKAKAEGLPDAHEFDTDD